jgi:hypothetical protein
MYVDALAGVRCGREWNHARLVDHLVRDHAVAGSLDDFVSIAVDGRHHRAGDPARDAAVVQASIFGRIRRTTGGAFPGAGGVALLGFSGRRRNLAVGRVRHKPGAAVVGKIFSNQ